MGMTTAQRNRHEHRLIWWAVAVIVAVVIGMIYLARSIEQRAKEMQEYNESLNEYRVRISNMNREMFNPKPTSDAVRK